VAEQPPTIVMFCNHPHALSAQYQRYLLGVFREHLKFGEVPIKLYLRRRESHDRTDLIESALKQ
jgi:GTP-binding protein